MATRDLLSVFGKYLEHFKGIEYDDFITLQPEHIKEAIPELVPRIRFQNLFKNFMQSLDDKNQTVLRINNNSAIVEDSYEDMTIEDTVFNYTSGVEPIFDEASFHVTPAPVGSIKILSNSDILIRTSGDIKSEIKTVQDIIDIPSIKLKIVITNYVNRNQPLDDFDRVIIAKTIIHHLLVGDLDLVIDKVQFGNLAKLIVQLFPRELLGTYYIPAVKNNQAQGKLYSAYQNYKADLREAGLIHKRAKASTTRDERPIQLAEKSEAFKIILEESEDFDQIVDCWNFCYEERQHLLSELSVFEYIRKFPAFNLARGYELLTLDANKLLGTKTSKLAEVAPKIILYASRKKRNSLEIKNILVAFKELSTNLDNLDILQQLTAISLLPHLMPIGKKKLNKTTVARLFCPYFKTEYEADKYNVEFKEDYKENSLVLKPRLYFFGDLSSPNVHIYFADQKYLIENCLIGFETLFKCFLGLNCTYPEETQHVWQFIQSEVYSIESGSDKQSSTMITFTQDIRTIVC